MMEWDISAINVSTLSYYIRSMEKKHIKCKHEGVRYPCDKCELAENTGGGLK